MSGRGLGAAVLLLATLGPSSASALPTIPPDFIQTTYATGLEQPVNFDFLPDGRILLVERTTARIRLMHTTGAVADTVGTVPGVRVSSVEGGLLGIAVDPRWPAKPYVYVHCTAASSFNIKVVRYALTGDLEGSGDGRLVLDLASRREILPDLPDDNGDHNGGTLLFGPDDMLYVALGDDHVPCAAQDIHQLRGKILRLRSQNVPDGGGPAPSYYTLDPFDNPFSKDDDPRARLVWQYGLRNPWSFDIDPYTDQVAIGDVGASRHEEVDVTYLTGRNFGWPFFEGPVPHQFTCDDPEFSTLTAPSYSYEHDTTGVNTSVILGGICSHPPLLPSGFPMEYWGQVFFLDLYAGRLARLACDADGACELASPVPGQPDAFAWGTGFSGVTRMRFGPDAMLWYVQGGELRRIHHPGVIGVPAAPLRALALRAFPVPARGEVRVAFTLPRAGSAGFAIADARGRRVRTLLPDGFAREGEHVIAWDGTDDHGARVPAGVYFGALHALGRTETRRIVLLSR